MDERKRYEQGMKVRREVLGDAHCMYGRLEVMPVMPRIRRFRCV